MARERPTYIQAQLDKARSKQTTAFAGIVTHEESRKLGAMVRSAPSELLAESR
jgi:hypothetical protein